MDTHQVCRICLAHDTRMYTIAYEPLQKFYQKITGKSFKMDNGRLPVFCYICYHILKKCHRFAETAIKADEVLQQICRTEVQISKEYISVKRNPLLFMAFKNSPVTVVNIEEVSEVKSEEGRDSPDVDWTSSEQERIVATEIDEYDIKSDGHIKEEADLDATGTEEDTLCPEDHHGSDTHGDDNQDVENGSILPEVKQEDEDKCYLEIPVDMQASAKCCAVVLRRDERIERMLQMTQFPHCRRARTPGPKNRKLDQSILYTESLRVQSSSRKNTVAETTSESEGITEANEKCSDKGHTQLYLSRKADCQKQYDQSNDKIRANVKNASDDSCNFNTSVTVHICNNMTTDKQKFVCDNCGIEFPSKKGLKTHLNLHGEKFNQIGLMTSHSKIHTDEKPFTCSHCGKKFSQKGNMKRHLRIHTGEKPYTCRHCGKKFNQIGSMKSHLRIHTGEKPYTCNHCGKKFSQIVTMKLHLRIHTGEKPYTCNHCGKKFRHIESMKKHLRIHTGEKPFKCDSCEKEFAIKSNLTTHIKRLHMGENTFSCSHCGKKNRTKQGLELHCRIHPCENPFKCDSCEKVFANKSRLTIHIKRMHMGERFTCSHCGKKFARFGMKLHLKTHAGNADTRVEN